MKIRQGRKIGRTLYLQRGMDPSDDDRLIGVMDTPHLAAMVASAMNEHLVTERDWADVEDELP